MNASGSQDAFTIERRGDITLYIASPALEGMEPGLVDGATALALEPLRDQETPLVVFDLSRIEYFSSTFLALLLRCWKLVAGRGGMMALSGASSRVRELLRITSLDLVWPIYADRREAIESLLAD